LQGNGVVPELTQSAVDVPVVEAIAAAPAKSIAAHTSEAPASDRPEPKATPRKAKAPTTQPKAKAKPTTAPAKSRRSLEVLPAYRGMSKREAIAQILEQRLGEVLHHDTIIQALYGDLSSEDLKKERIRIDTSLHNGVKANKWKKAPVPASYVIKSTASAPAAKAKAAKPKLGRKVARSKKTELELVVLLRKADIQV
jgi:hypothetical protein